MALSRPLSRDSRAELGSGIVSANHVVPTRTGHLQAHSPARRLVHFVTPTRHSCSSDAMSAPNTFTQSVYPFSHSALTQHLYLSFLVAGPLARKHFERRTHVVPLGHVSSNSKDLRSSNAVRRSVIKGRLSPGEHRSICMRPSAGRALSRGHAGVRRIVV
jgi:hypothetical protein